MKLYPEELSSYEAYKAVNQDKFIPLSNNQLDEINLWVNEKSQWVAKNKNTHNLISIVLMLALLSADFLCCFILLEESSTLMSQLSLGAIHGFFIYSISNYYLHEAGGHNRIFLGSSFIVKAFKKTSFNMPRIFFNDPVFYTSTHGDHHNKIATEGDKAFTHFVLPKRFFLSLLPLASALPFCDYKIHCSNENSPSKMISNLVGMAFLSLNYFFIKDTISLKIFVLFHIFAFWVAFTFDRLRETTEHNLMIDSKYGARNLGHNLLGFVISGGPIGQPFHLSHHLAPSLPWYFQIKLASEIKRLLSEDQKKIYLVNSSFDYTRLMVKVLSENMKYTYSKK